MIVSGTSEYYGGSSFDTGSLYYCRFYLSFAQVLVTVQNGF